MGCFGLGNVCSGFKIGRLGVGRLGIHGHGKCDSPDLCVSRMNHPILSPAHNAMTSNTVLVIKRSASHGDFVAIGQHNLSKHYGPLPSFWDVVSITQDFGQGIGKTSYLSPAVKAKAGVILTRPRQGPQFAFGHDCGRGRGRGAVAPCHNRLAAHIGDGLFLPEAGIGFRRRELQCSKAVGPVIRGNDFKLDVEGLYVVPRSSNRPLSGL